MRDAELQRRILDARLLDLHTALPCEVQSFDATAQTIDVKPMVKAAVQARDDSEFEESYPLIRSVPVIYPRSGNYFVAFELAKGDIVTVVFNEWSIDRFRNTGSEGHPIDTQRHGFGGAVAFPGGPYPTNSPISETISGLVVGKDGGTLLRIGSDGIAKLGASADSVEALAIASKVKGELDKIVITLGTGSTPSGAVTWGTPYTAAAVAATKVHGV